MDIKNFIFKKSLYLLSGLGFIVGIIIFLNWSEISFLQRMLGFFFIAIIFHLWEEGKFPGGFTKMITDKLNFTQISPEFGEMVVSLYTVLLISIPLFFPKLLFLAMAPMILGIIEVIAHLAAIKMFKLKKFYSPGLFTALFIMLPISIITIKYVVQQNLLTPIQWLYSFIYMVVGLMIAQRIVVIKSGMKYFEFLRNVRKTLFDKDK